jgi:hypothetical protein
MLRSLSKKHRQSLAIALLSCLLRVLLWPAAVMKEYYYTLSPGTSEQNTADRSNECQMGKMAIVKN